MNTPEPHWQAHRFGDQPHALNIKWENGPWGQAPLLATDWFGPNPRAQVVCYSADQDEVMVCVRFDANGKIVEVAVADGVRVVRDSDSSPWLDERDEGEVLKPTYQERLKAGLTQVGEGSIE